VARRSLGARATGRARRSSRPRRPAPPGLPAALNSGKHPALQPDQPRRASGRGLGFPGRPRYTLRARIEPVFSVQPSKRERSASYCQTLHALSGSSRIQPLHRECGGDAG